MKLIVFKQRWSYCFLTLLVSTLLFITFAFAQGNGNKADDRLPPPPDSLARDSVAAVQDVFREELAKAKQPQQKSTLAKQLMSQAINLEQPYERWAMLSEATRLAAEAGDVETALDAAGAISKGYAIDAMALELDVIRRMSSHATAPVARELAKRVLTMSESLASAGDLQRAEQVAEMMPQLLVRARDRQLSMSLQVFQKKIDNQMKARKAQEKAEQKLAAKRSQLMQRVHAHPEDPGACLEAGHFFCFELNDWQTGLPLLARGADPLLAQVAESELTAATGYEILEVAEGWFRWAEDQKGSKQHAGLTRSIALFSKVIAKAAGLEKLRIEKRLSEVQSLLSDTSNLDPDAADYVRRVEAADGRPLEPKVKAAINYFVLNCKSDGIWDSLKACCLLCGPRTLAGALVPLRGDAPTAYGFDDGDYDRSGLTGDGTSYLNSNVSANTYDGENHHWSVFLTSGGTANRALLGYITNNLVGQPEYSYSFLFTDDSSMLFYYFGASTYYGGQGAATGFAGLSSSAGSSFTTRLGGTNKQASFSQTPYPADYYLFCRNNGPTDGAASITDATIAFYSIGTSLDLTKLDSHISSYVTAIGAAL